MRRARAATPASWRSPATRWRSTGSTGWSTTSPLFTNLVAGPPGLPRATWTTTSTPRPRCSPRNGPARAWSASTTRGDAASSSAPASRSRRIGTGRRRRLAGPASTRGDPAALPAHRARGRPPPEVEPARATSTSTNTALAAAALVLLGEDAAAVGEAVLTDPHVPGRMEAVAAPDGADAPRAVVDYAHTPEAIRAALRALRRRTPGSLVVVTRRRRRPRPRQAPGDGRAPPPRSPTSSSSPTTTRAPRTRRHPRGGPARASRRRGPPGATSRCSRSATGGPPSRRPSTPAGPRGRPPRSPSSARATRAARRSAAWCTPSTTGPSWRGAPPRGRGGRRVIALSLAEIAQVTGGPSSCRPASTPARVVVDGPVVTDSREAGPGGLFVARVGEHADGHDFVAGAVERGAVAALVTRPVEGVPCVVVADTQDAFAALAREVVRRLPGAGRRRHHRLVGQDQHQGPARPPCSPRPGRPWPRWARYNTEVGVPLTVCGSTADTRFLVVEMGARGIGHIAYLARIAPPDGRRRAQRRHRARRRVRLARGDRHGQVRARRGAAAATGWPCSTPTTRWCAAMAVGDRPPGSCSSARPTTPTCAPPTSPSTPRGRASFTAARRAGQPAPCTLRPGRATPRRQRPGRGRRGPRARPAARVGLCRTGVRATASAGGGWRSSSAPTASPSSTTPTTPTPTRCAPRSPRWSGWARAGAPGPCSARCSSSATSPTPLHAEIGAEVVARGVDELVVVGPARRGAGRAERAPRARHPAAPAPACGRCRTPTAPRRCSTPSSPPGDVVLVKSSRDAGLRLLGDRLAAAEGGADVKAVLIAAVVSLVIALFGTPVFIRFLVRKGYGQFIRDDGPTSHHTKRGTPTMGGAVIVGSSLLGYAVAHLVTGSAAHGQRPAGAVPDDRARPGRLPRRLHQDLQAAQPRPARGDEARRPDARRA